MSRPEKQTAEYFKHYVDEDPTTAIMQNAFGNDGYSCLNKLKELLCKSKKHVYDARNPQRWWFLVSKMGVSEELTHKMLGLLSEIGYIDKPLWDNMLIWCEELVENLEDLYDKRKGERPIKPNLSDFGSGNNTKTIVSDPETRGFDSF